MQIHIIVARLAMMFMVVAVAFEVCRIAKNIDFVLNYL